MNRDEAESFWEDVHRDRLAELKANEREYNATTIPDSKDDDDNISDSSIPDKKGE
jgi:hypothetical protein